MCRIKYSRLWLIRLTELAEVPHTIITVCVCGHRKYKCVVIEYKLTRCESNTSHHAVSCHVLSLTLSLLRARFLSLYINWWRKLNELSLNFHEFTWVGIIPCVLYSLPKIVFNQVGICTPKIHTHTYVHNMRANPKKQQQQQQKCMVF